MGRSKRGGKRQEFLHQYQGPELLGELLELAGCPLTMDEVVARLRDGVASGRRAAEVIPTLFEGEPTFGDPLQAQLTFQNLLGLWDLLASGAPLPSKRVARPPRVKKPAPVAPGRFAARGPDTQWVEAAWRYLEDLPERERTRLLHSFENRQDALLGHLDDAGLPDDGYLAVRHLVFELHAMIELGWPPGVAAVHDQALRGEVAGEAPAALKGYADEALFELEQDEEAPLRAEDAAKARQLVGRCLDALWAARKKE